MSRKELEGLTYAIFNVKDHFILPDQKKYYNEVKYANCDYLRYFKSNSKWTYQEKIHKGVFFSNYEAKSYIKAYSNPLVRHIADKANLANMIEGESYSPNTVTFRLINGKVQGNIKWYPEVGSLWFLKKSGDLTYGGFDVFPILVKSRKEAMTEIQANIYKSNEHKKYYEDSFLLQKGIDNPLLMSNGPLEYKFDIRAYGLVVKIPDHDHEFYFFKKYLNRRSMSPYNPKDTSTSVMLTNTTQAGVHGVPIEDLTSIGDDVNNHDIYESIYEVYSELCNNHLRKFDSNSFKNPSINIIGIDFIFDSKKNPYILEINKFPAIHCDPIKRKKFHHNMEESMFDTDFFDITFNSIIEETPYLFSTQNYFHVI